MYSTGRGDNVDHDEVEIRMVPVVGGKSVRFIQGRLSDGVGAVDHARLSPDGSFLSYRCGVLVSICVANADGTEERELGQWQGDALNGGDRSPDGMRVAYYAFHAQDVFIADVATGQVAYVAEGAGPTWLNDHTLIVEIARCYNRATGAWGRGEGCLG